MKYTAKDVIKAFIDYFKEKGHVEIENASILPEADGSLLFINAGMAPIKRCFTGEVQPKSKRMCNVQTCIRTNDVESVGDRHHLTAFHMLGSWSIGDYFKEDAIKFASDLLINRMKIPKEKLYATVFSGDEKRNLPKDEESEKIWHEVGFNHFHCLALPFDDNFWRMGDGECPCGPCTEVFFDSGEDKGNKYETTGEFDTKKRYLEIWNAGVFMQYFQHADGSFTELCFKSVDTGAGLERLLMTLNGLDNVYETELFLPVMNKIKEYATNFNILSQRIIADHTRSALLIFNSSLMPSNVKAGYILRMLIRRAFRHARKLGLTDVQYLEIVSITYDTYFNCFSPKFNYTKDEFLEKFKIEQEKFSKLLKDGLKVFEEYLALPEVKESKQIPAKLTFKLYDTFGFPFEITQELAKEHGLNCDENEFNELLSLHKQNSKDASFATFKSGLSDTDPQTIAHHTATHLLHAGLRKVLGEQVCQKGSNITPERLRFDFNFERKMTQEEIKQVEDYVNEAIKNKIDVIREEMSPKQAKDSGAIGLFDNKYGDIVSVYTIKGYSKEICSGPHINNTGELEFFKILKEESSSANIRRIKAYAPLKK